MRPTAVVAWTVDGKSWRFEISEDFLECALDDESGVKVVTWEVPDLGGLIQAVTSASVRHLGGDRELLTLRDSVGRAWELRGEEIVRAGLPLEDGDQGSGSSVAIVFRGLQAGVGLDGGGSTSVFDGEWTRREDLGATDSVSLTVFASGIMLAVDGKPRLACSSGSWSEMTSQAQKGVDA